MKTKKVTLTDLAKALDVSTTLISLVLNGKGDENSISKLTQKRVFEKAAELNYKPNFMARGLRMGKTKTIGLLVADISNPFFGKITRTIEYYADLEGYKLLVCSSDEDPEREKELIKTLIDRQVDGIIMTTTQQDVSQIEELKRNKFPFVLVDRYLSDVECNYVGVDNYEATKKVVTKMLEHGHRNIAFITVTPGYISSLQDRKKGYLDAIIEHGIEPDSSNILEVDYDDLKRKDYSSIRDFLDTNKTITALFTTNNGLAVSCLDATTQLGIEIPNELSVVTFDDLELFKYITPKLSAIAQPKEDIGERAFSNILAQLKDASSDIRYEVLETLFIQRES